MYDRVLKELRDAKQPMFAYFSTMRQHSPHVDRYPKGAFRAEILQEYGRRLELSAQEARAFMEDLRTLDRPTIVLMYGDHIPSDVLLGFPLTSFRVDPRRTFFNIFDAEGNSVTQGAMSDFQGFTAISTGFLDAVLLRAAGFDGRYISQKLELMQQCAGVFCETSADGPEQPVQIRVEPSAGPRQPATASS
jgi:hypothetical protein